MLLMFAISTCVLTAQRVRKIPWDPTQPLSHRVLPSDEVVIVEQPLNDLSDRVGSHTYLSTKDVIEDAAVEADAVVMADVDAVTNVLTDQDSWIRARLDAVVREIIRQSRGPQIAVGQQIQVFFAAGEMTMNGVRVIARDDPEDATQYGALLPIHRRYLLFVAHDTSAFDHTLIAMHTPALVVNGTFRYPWPPPTVWYEPPAPLQGRSIPYVIDIIKHAKTSWRERDAPSTLKAR